MNFEIPTPLSAGIVLSYKCNAACRHCMYACSPRWKADWISREDLYRMLSNLADKILPSPYGRNTMDLNYGLHFTGGEPFLNLELLCDAVEMAAELEIPSLFVETNCYWAVSDEVASHKLNLLKKKGLNGILISVNPFYLEYVPFERTERAIRISQQVLGNNVMVYQLEYYRKFRSLGVAHKLSFDDYLQMENGGDFAANAEFFISGRAAYTIGAYHVYPRYRAKHLLGEQCRPPFIRQWHNHFDNYGNFVPGYCGGLSLGNALELDRLLQEGIDPKEHPVLTFIIGQDFEGLLSFSKDRGYSEHEEGYLSKCHLCADIRRHLVETEDFRELSPRGFYSELR